MTEHVISIPLVLGDQISGIKIGKILDPIEYTNASIISDNKIYKLEERKNDKTTKKFSGQHFAEQTSKYVLMTYNESTRKIEVNPVTEWFLFKKDIKLKTIDSKELEDRKKQQMLLKNSFKYKTTEQDKKTKKTKKTKGNDKEKGGETNMKEENEEKEKIKDDDYYVDSHSSENDPGLKDIDSDIENNLNIEEKNIKEENIYKKINEEDRNIEENGEDDSQFNDSYDIDNEIENADSEVNEDEFEEIHILGEKRFRDENNQDGFGFAKKKTVFDSMCETLDKMLSRNGKMIYEKIVNEMQKQFSSSDIEEYLCDVLTKHTKTFDEKGKIFYCKKNI